MAVTTNQLQTVISSTPFRQRVEYAIVLAALAVASEATSTTSHAQRKSLSASILNSPDNFVTQFAQAIVTQFPLSTTNMVTVNSAPNADVDTTDATISTEVSSVYNAMFI